MKNCKKGITLVEIIVVIFIIALFTIIMISDFPKMLRQLGLSRATYNFSQDLRKTQDLGLSGVKLSDINNQSISVKGYGIYINLSNSIKQYIIYADVANASGSADQKYSGDLSFPLCSKVNQIISGNLVTDCVVSIINLTTEDQSLSFDSITNVSGAMQTSINFSPPGPITKIDGLDTLSNNNIGVVIKNSDGAKRTVYINTSGLITVQ